MKLHISLLSFSWDHEFKVLNDGTFPAILGLDFLQQAQIRVDLPTRTFRLAFALDRVGSFSPAICGEGNEAFLQQFCVEATELTTISQVRLTDLWADVLMTEFPHFFSSSLCTAKCVPHDIELSDTTPVRLPPYQRAPHRLQIFKHVANELLEQGVIRLSKSRYASPAILVPKNGGGFCMVVDYRTVNS